MMRDKIYLALIMSLGVVLTLASGQAFGGSGAAFGAKSASSHSTFHPIVRRSQHLHKGRHTRRAGHTGALWPTVGTFSNTPENPAPEVGVTGPRPGESHYTCTLDIPWDWVHRCPPFVGSSQSLPKSFDPVTTPIVPGCPSVTVKVPTGDGKEQTVTIVRC